jgi:arginyl-tRNA synthetase
MRKSDGTFTYFVPDVAYHLAKFDRGFNKAINIQGTDHHGTIARVRAGLQAAAAGVPASYPDYVLNTMVRVERGGAEVKISKRAGNYVTLRDLIDWTSRDAVRFFMLSRKADTEFTFDVDLALKQNDENPVFYVQYAHARIHSIEKVAREREVTRVPLADVDLGLLVHERELDVLRTLSELPDVVELACNERAPHKITAWVRELAGAFHGFYHDCYVMGEGVSAELTQARLALVEASRVGLAIGLDLLGVSAPESM